ncbi:MAG: Na+/H+-dicarboxylate symporter [Patiriisocius sp.]|jgi:Na+/H+-dicarboxylate symporter
MIVVSWAMMLVPYTVFGLMAALLPRASIEIFFGLGYYMFVVMLGLLILFLFYLLLALRVTKKNHFKFLKAIREPHYSYFLLPVLQL